MIYLEKYLITMMSTVVSKYRKFFLSFLVYVFVFMAFAAFGIDIILLNLLIFGILGFGFLFMSLKCPNCKKPVLKRNIDFMGGKFVMWSILLPDQCPSCHCYLKKAKRN